MIPSALICQSQEPEGSDKPERIKEVHSKLHLLPNSIILKMVFQTLRYKKEETAACTTGQYVWRLKPLVNNSPVVNNSQVSLFYSSPKCTAI